MAEENPWKTVGTREVYRNPWFSLREDQVIRPDGKPGIYAVVEPKIATGIVPIDDEGYTWLVGQYRYAIERYSWEIVEGGVDPGESSRDAAIRELKEEAGLSAREVMELGGPFYLSNCFTSERADIFIAHGISAGTAQPEATEVLQIRRLPFSEALEMVHRGEITDAVSIIALQRAEQHRAGRNR